jgi:gallate dioxygenase
LGKALRRAIESYPADLRVAVVATGGLSHQVHGERAGFNNVPWDNEFLDALTNDPSQLATMTHAEYAELGGVEGAEVIMWLIMRGALSDNVTRVHSSAHLPAMTTIGTLILENHAEPLPTAAIERHRALMATQLAGAERLAGSYPFTLAGSTRTYRLNKFLHDMVMPAHRDLFRSDEEASFAAAGLTDEEQDLLRRRDWRGLIHYGVIFFGLEKLAAVLGLSNQHVYAAMRGEPLDAFLATRPTQALYSVAGSDEARAKLGAGAATP